jgi:nitrile hydratase accessory protein
VNNSVGGAAASALRGEAALPKDQEGSPVFAEPWQAQAFSLVVKLFEAGHYTWPEWVKFLSAEIAAAKDTPAGAHEPQYYEQWLAAAEKLFIAKGLTTREELAARKFGLAVTPQHGAGLRRG